MMTSETDFPEIGRAVSLLLAGELVAFPTETVYGLGADAANPGAVGRIFAAKGRPADHPLIVHLAGSGDMAHWAADIPPQAWELASAFWPGPLTLILKKQDWVSPLVTGGQASIGLRVPAHPVAQALLQAFAKVSATAGIAAPSANRFGRVSPTLASHVREELGEQVACVLDGGPCQVGIESTILDLTRFTQMGAVVLRPGCITPDELEKILGGHSVSLPASRGREEGADTPRVSGSLDSHYAPATPLLLCPTEELSRMLAREDASGRRVGLLSCRTKPETEPGTGSAHIWRWLGSSPEGYARALYATLRELDEHGLARIIVETPPATPDWQAVLDRLYRAAAK
ncbi:MAG: threonylcarbamoyl-AMP synthase [Zoogloeaceae bacterium]|jgi:L-threonylcarbamoyladenylate synthase|nr:threonylcarbamoyl-AMP synthase [Zoogloeaceae bacterium]